MSSSSSEAGGDDARAAKRRRHQDAEEAVRRWYVRLAQRKGVEVFQQQTLCKQLQMRQRFRMAIRNQGIPFIDVWPPEIDEAYDLDRYDDSESERNKAEDKYYTFPFNELVLNNPVMRQLESKEFAMTRTDDRGCTQLLELKAKWEAEHGAEEAAPPARGGGAHDKIAAENVSPLAWHFPRHQAKRNFCFLCSEQSDKARTNYKPPFSCEVCRVYLCVKSRDGGDSCFKIFHLAADPFGHPRFRGQVGEPMTEHNVRLSGVEYEEASYAAKRSRQARRDRVKAMRREPGAAAADDTQ
jgi:hypothetical protein